MRKITVIGAGNPGLGMSAHLSLLGFQVRLWNRTAANIDTVQKTKTIHATGVVKGNAKIEFATADLFTAIHGSELIIVTTPADAHGEIAQRLRSTPSELPPILLSPGRTLGVHNFKYNLARPEVLVAEAQTVVHTCRALTPSSVHFFALKSKVKLAATTPPLSLVFHQALPAEIAAFYEVAASWVETSLGNVGMILHSAPMIFNAGWVESGLSFKFYSEGISPRLARLLEKLDAERVAVASALGVHIPSLQDWLGLVYGSNGTNLFTSLQDTGPYHFIDAPRSLSHRYISEDITCGLVPVETLARQLRVKTRAISTVIEAASELLEIDFRAKGREVRWEQLGLGEKMPFSQFDEEKTPPLAGWEL